MTRRMIFPGLRVAAAVVIIVLTPLPALAQMTQINNGTAAQITGPTYGCRIVTNNSGQSTMVPWNTAAEWLSVINTPGTGVSVSGCPYCGDGSCNGGETCGTCSGDCGTCCCGSNSTYCNWFVTETPSCDGGTWYIWGQTESTAQSDRMWIQVTCGHAADYYCNQ